MTRQAAEPADAVLARRASDGDREAAGMLIDRHHAAVRRFLRRLTGRDDVADDLAQDTFVRLLRYVDRYDERYPMRTWLLTIARRLTINRARHESRSMPSDDLTRVQSGGPDPSEPVQRDDEQTLLRQQLDAAIEKLSPPQREAVVLFHQQQLSVQDVAAVMQLPVGTVKSHLHRGRAVMRQYLSAHCEVA